MQTKTKLLLHLLPNACASSNWNSTSTSGTLVKELLTTPVDNFLSCTDEPQLITDLKDQFGNEGQELTFKINAVGPNLNYTWFLNDEEIADAPNTSTYTVSNLDPSQDGELYKVVVSNTEGNLTSREAVLTVFANGPFEGAPISIPGRIEAENYDVGGEGITYNDSDDGNNGGVYRYDDVDISSTTDGGEGFSVGWTESGEWLSYTIDVQKAGLYDFEFRTASEENSKVSIRVNDEFVVGNESIPASGGWDTWETHSFKEIELVAGEQEFKLYITTGPVNINYIDVVDHKDDPTNGIFENAYNKHGISLYPNPTSGILNISSEELSLANAKIEVLDMTGVSILNTSGNSEINVTSLDAGMYMLRVSTENKEVYLKWLKK